MSIAGDPSYGGLFTFKKTRGLSPRFVSFGFPCWSLLFRMLGCKFAANPSIDRTLYKVNSQALFSFKSVKCMLFALFGAVSKSLTTFVGGVIDLWQSNLKRAGQRAAGEIASKPIGSQRFGQDKTGNFLDA